MSAKPYFTRTFASDSARGLSNPHSASSRATSASSSVPSRGVTRVTEPAFKYPTALSESVSEDAVVDDLLSLRNPQFPRLRNPSVAHVQSNHHTASSTLGAASHRGKHHVRSMPQTDSMQPNRNGGATSHSTHTTSGAASGNRLALLPALTRKRRSLWQWLFCSDNVAPSTTVPSVGMSSSAVRDRLRSSSNVKPPGTSAVNHASRTSPSSKHASKDRVTNGDKDFFHRSKNAADAPAVRNRGAGKRSPSFEIRRGKPEHANRPGRSLSWNFVPRAFLGRDRDRETQKTDGKDKKKKKKSTKTKDKPRCIIVDEENEPPKTHRIGFQKGLSRKSNASSKELSREQPRKSAVRVVRKDDEEAKTKRSLDRERMRVNLTGRGDRPREDRPREDRPREDRPRELAQGQLKEVSGGAPLQKSVVPSLREKTCGSGSFHSQRMRSGESCDPVTSRISSDLSSTTYGRNGSDSGHSIPIHVKQQYRNANHDLDPAANGVSSDVSSHLSVGGHGKTSPVRRKEGPSPVPSALSSSSDSTAFDVKGASSNPSFRSKLFAFPSSSTESGGGFIDRHKTTAAWESPPKEYPELSNNLKSYGSIASQPSMDPVARAKEKNKARSAGGPLSYLMKQHESEGEINTESTGLTSLADESVSTHKTMSAIGENPQYASHNPGIGRNPFREAKKATGSSDVHDSESSESGGAPRPIFQNYALFNHSDGMSPSHVSSGASPRRFHSDWSDPHATDIDVYCQCNCSCVYEEECRRTCELIFGRSPSVSSTRSRRGYQGFQSLPPAIDSSGYGHRMGAPDISANRVRGPFGFKNGMNVGVATGEHTSTHKSFIRANAVDELPDPVGTGYAGGHNNIAEGVARYSPSGAKGGYTGQGTRVKEWSEKTGATESRHVHPRERSANMRHGKGPTNGHGSSTQGGLKSTGVERGSTPRAENSGERYGKSGMSGTHRHGSISRNSEEVKHRSSSRQTGDGSHTSRSSGSGKRGEKQRSSVRDEGRRRDGEEKDSRRQTHSRRRNGSRTDGGEKHMGNSYVVKRSGLPPVVQTNIPQAFRGNVYNAEDVGVGNGSGWEEQMGRLDGYQEEFEMDGGSRLEAGGMLRHKGTDAEYKRNGGAGQRRSEGHGKREGGHRTDGHGGNRKVRHGHESQRADAKKEGQDTTRKSGATRRHGSKTSKGGGGRSKGQLWNLLR